MLADTVPQATTGEDAVYLDGRSRFGKWLPGAQNRERPSHRESRRIHSVRAFCREGGIRTRGAFRRGSLSDCCLKPLSHLWRSALSARVVLHRWPPSNTLIAWPHAQQGLRVEALGVGRPFSKRGPAAEYAAVEIGVSLESDSHDALGTSSRSVPHSFASTARVAIPRYVAPQKGRRRPLPDSRGRTQERHALVPASTRGKNPPCSRPTSPREKDTQANRGKRECLPPDTGLRRV